VNRGIGRRLAELFVERRHRVWGTSRTGDRPDGLAGCVHLELRSERSIIAAAETIGHETDAVDLLVNCAGADAGSYGVGDSGSGPFDVDRETFNAILDTNVTGPMLVTRHLLPLVRRGTNPVIVDVSSQMGSISRVPHPNDDCAYCASKAALNMVGVMSSAALRPAGIALVMLHPGWVATDMGGPSADLDLNTAASAIIETIGSLTMADTGRFIRWDGHDHPW
jgi:NAD(P)-dependent dehydrogenase (short-subunit alcohol dehydrogenase family)